MQIVWTCLTSLCWAVKDTAGGAAPCPSAFPPWPAISARLISPLPLGVGTVKSRKRTKPMRRQNSAVCVWSGVERNWAEMIRSFRELLVISSLVPWRWSYIYTVFCPVLQIGRISLKSNFPICILYHHLLILYVCSCRTATGGSSNSLMVKHTGPIQSRDHLRIERRGSQISHICCSCVLD